MHSYAPKHIALPVISKQADPASLAWEKLRVSMAAEQFRRLMGLLLGTLIATFTICCLANRSGSFLLLWPVGGLALGQTLCTWKTGWKRRLPFQVAVVLSTMLGALLAGQTSLFVLVWTLVTALDMLLAGSYLGPHISTFEDLKRRANIIRFVLAATVVPVLSGAAVIWPAAWLQRSVSLPSVGLSVLADSLGLAVALPAVLFMTTGEYRTLRKLAPHLRSAAGAGLFFVAVTSAAFWQCRGPFLFIIFPPMMLVLLLLGLEGAVFTSVVLAVVGWFATAHAHGPIWLMRNASPETCLLVLQSFIWTCLATALPVGALLDERRRAERRVLEAQSVYQLLLQNTSDTIVLSSTQGARCYVSPAIEQLTGWTPAEYVNFTHAEVVHPDDRELVDLLNESLQQGKRDHTVRYRIRQKAGGWRWVETSVRGYGDESVVGYVGTIRDIAAQRQAEKAWQAERSVLAQEREQMASLAGTDPLTGLLNRRGLEEGMNQVLEREPVAVLMIDIDFFKQFNDRYGHGEGDLCLTRLGAAISGQARRQGDLVARLGGEEFIVVLHAADGRAGLAVADAICKELQRLAIEHASSPLGFVSVSIGVAAHSGGGEMDFNLLLTQADRALYASKHAGKNRATVFHAPAGSAVAGSARTSSWPEGAVQAAMAVN